MKSAKRLDAMLTGEPPIGEPVYSPARLVWVRFQKHLTPVLAVIALFVVGAFFFLPWMWLLSSALKTLDQIFVQPPVWIPNPMVWSNFYSAVTYIPFFKYMQNTLVICGLVVIGRLISCSLVAYGFSQVRWKGRDTVFFFVLATLMLPFQVTMIPLFVIFSKVNLVDTILPLVLPTFFGDAFFIFLLRQFFLSIPHELCEAALIDGANHFDIYSRIVMPLARPALATVIIFSFLWTYTDFQGPLIYLTSEAHFTLSLGLRGFFAAHGAQWNYMMAASFLFTLPVVILFFFAQRTFIEGIVTTGLK
jgi:multiple sugar transport system permease protein